MEMKQNQLVKTFKEWGPEFHVEFDITIYQHAWKMLRFFMIGTMKNFGTPNVWFDTDGCIRIRNTNTNGSLNQKKFCPQIDKTSHVAIKQIRNVADAQNIYYSINVDGENIHNAKIDAPKTYKHVMFYASDVYEESPFNSTFGIIENVIVYQSMYYTMYLNNVIIPTSFQRLSDKYKIQLLNYYKLP